METKYSSKKASDTDKDSTEKKSLLSRIKNSFNSSNAKKTVATLATICAIESCTTYNSYNVTGSDNEIYGYENPAFQKSDVMHFNPYMFQRNSLFMINGARWNFSHFNPAQNMLFFYNNNGNSQVFFQISIGNLPGYNFQYFNNGQFMPFFRNDYNSYWNNNHIQNNMNHNRHPNDIIVPNKYPTSRNYQNNIYQQNKTPPQRSSRNRR